MVRSLVKFFQTPSGRIYAYDGVSSRIITVNSSDNVPLDDELCDRLYGQLKNKGIIEDADAFEKIEWKCGLEEYKALTRNRIPRLLLELTKKCNLNCAYCSVSGAVCAQSRKNCMTEESLFKAIDFFISRNGECESADIDFYGGEALIRFDLIKKAVSYASEKIKDKPLNFGISTNGLLLNDETAKWLSENPNVRFTCTVNGPYHDLYRKTLSGRGSLGDIMKNLNNIRCSYSQVWKNQTRFIANVNDKTEISPMLDFYRDEVGMIPGMITTIDWSDNEAASPQKPEKPFNIYDEIDFGKDAFKGDYFRQVLRTIHRRTVKRGDRKGIVCSCFPAEVKIFVKYDGKIGFCEQACEASVIGDLENGIDENTLGQIYNEASDLYNKKCRYCWAQRLCDNCIARLQDENGNMLRSIPESLCETVKNQLADNLVLYCKMAEESPELLKSI